MHKLSSVSACTVLTAGAADRCPDRLADTVHDIVVGKVVRFDFLYPGDSEVTQRSHELDQYA